MSYTKEIYIRKLMAVAAIEAGKNGLVTRIDECCFLYSRNNAHFVSASVRDVNGKQVDAQISFKY